MNASCGAEALLSSAVSQAMPQHIAVAWSGGADSTALLMLLKDAGHAVQAWHVDHGWQPSSADVASSLALQAKAWHIPFFCKRIEKPQRNLEAEARQGRYAAFAALAEEQACYDLALGHHAGDQAETVCMRLLQGAGVAGCQGMRVCRQQGDLRLWRPLLGVSRSKIEDWLQARGIAWLDDPSNADTLIWRNKIRKRLFPAMQKVGVEPELLFLRWQKQAEQVQQQIVLQAQAVEVMKHSLNDDVFCAMNWQGWLEQRAPVRAYLLQQMIGLLFADGRVFGRRHILAIEAWREHGGHSWLNLSRCCLYREGNGLQLCQGKTSLRRYNEKDVSKG